MPSRFENAPTTADAGGHASRVDAQFTSQAPAFAKSPTLHTSDALALIVQAAAPAPHHATLDVACGPGTIVAAFAPLVGSAVGLDATEAMLDEARRLADEQRLKNVSWLRGDVYSLPYEADTFDIVTCRFAFHHFEYPERAFAEMQRVCRPDGRLVVCDGIASPDPAQARAFNAMERLRDPSTVEFRSAVYLRSLFTRAGLNARESSYVHVASMQRLLQSSFPLDGDRERIRTLIEASVDDDAFGMKARRQNDDVFLDCPVLILSAQKPAQPSR